MKKTFVLLLSISFLFFLSACTSSVSQDDYNRLVRNYSDLQNQYDTLLAKYNDLNVEHDENFIVEKNMVISFNFGEREGIYTGTVNSSGLPDGFGKFQSTSASGNDWVYYGEWSDGHFNGNGITQWEETSHIGLYEMDYMEGSGIYFYEDGSVFCGEFSESQPATSYISESSDDLLLSNSENTPSEEIINGELYDSVTSIYQDISLFDFDGKLSIQINLPHKSYEEDSINFFSILTSICESCKLEEDYSSITFFLYVDDDSTAMLTMVDYESPTSFSSMEPFVFIDEYKESISKLYAAVFSSNDIGTTFENNLDSLREKYGIGD